MGKKGSVLVPFIIEGLKKNKYLHYLKYVGDEINNTFEIVIPRKTKDLHCESMKILKDWVTLKGQKLKTFDYTKAKQRLKSALKRSEYLERIPNSNQYRILCSTEVKAKKERLKIAKQSKIEFSSPPSIESSGYDSFVESPMTTEPMLDNNLVDSPLNNNLICDNDSDVDSPSSYSGLNAGNDPITEEGNSFLVKHDEESIIDVSPLESDVNLPLNLPMSDAEIQPYIDSLSSEDFSPEKYFEEFLTQPEEVKKKTVLLKKYYLKWHLQLDKTIMLICEPKEDIPFDENMLYEAGMISNESLSQEKEILVDKYSFPFILDEALFQVISSFEWTEIEYRDDHLLLYLKPRNISVQNL